jgi:hypothetical protein
VRLFSRDNFPNNDVVSDFREITGFPKITLPVRRAYNPSFDDLTVLAIRALAARNDIEPGPLTIAMKRAGFQLPRSRDNLVVDDAIKAKIASYYATSNEKFLSTSGMTLAEAEYFRMDRIPERKTVNEAAIAAKTHEVVEQLVKIPKLEEYAHLRPVD